MFKKVTAVFMTFMLGLFGLMSSAHAALDASVSAGFLAVQSDAEALSAIVVPIVVTLLGLSIVIKLIKRFGNKI